MSARVHSQTSSGAPDRLTGPSRPAHSNISTVRKTPLHPRAFPVASAIGCTGAASLLGVALATLTTLLVLIPQGAQAQPYLVSDLDKRATGSGPTSFVALGEHVFFSADRSDVGREVFRSDGTPEGTRVLVDTNPGPLSSASESPYSPREVMVAGERVFFLAYTENIGTRIWATRAVPNDDEASVLSAADPNIGTSLRADELLGKLGSKLLFIGDEPTGGLEPWITDGTDAGTFRLGDLVPGTGDSRPEGFAVVGDHAYFLIHPSLQPYELWRTDGTVEGTERIDEALGPFDYVCPGRGVFGATAQGLVFAAGREGHYCEPWVTDGTGAGTRLLSDLPGSGFGSFFGGSFEDGDRLFFANGSSLWVTDGKPDGTRLLLDDHLTREYTFTVAGNRLFFSAFDFGLGSEPWVSDGTPQGTHQLLDLYPGPFSSTPENFTTFGDRVVFSARTPDLGRELWITDGTADGTTLLADIISGEQSSSPVAHALGERIWISAETPESGREPWISDGSPSGTRQLLDLKFDGTESSGLYLLSPFRDQVIMGLHSGTDPLVPNRERLWLSDGTEAGTFPMADPVGLEISFPRNLTATSDAFYFTAYDEAVGIELMRYDGEGATTLLELEAGPEGSFPHNLRAVGEKLFFTRLIDDNFELWRLNQSGASATFLADLRVDGTGGNPVEPAAPDPSKGPYFGVPLDFFQVVGDRFLAATIVTDSNGDGFADPTDEEWLWLSDGTIDGTNRVMPVKTLTSTNGVLRFTAVGDALFFFSQGEDEVYELWRSEGTGQTTERLARFDFVPGISYPAFLISHRGRAYFGFLQDSNCVDLWQVEADGTGLQDLDIECINTPSSRAGQLFYSDFTSDTGWELWRLTGEPLRPELVADVEPGTGDSGPVMVGETPGIAYFKATTHSSGQELWRTDGTPEGTQMVGDIAPGRESSSVLNLAATPDRLFFTADDRIHGTELWATPLGCLPSSETLCLGDGRFQVRARWRDAFGDFGEGLAKTRPLTDDSGAFWFFDQNNIELAVKVLDGRELTGAFWVFYASLSNVEFELEVLDTESGELAVYKNEAGSMASVGDTSAIPALGTSPVSQKIWQAAPFEAATPAAKNLCESAPDVLCLGEGRFRITANWQDFDGGSGVGMAGRLSDDTGTFWFFDNQNVEMLIKILDGTSFNGHHWVFYASLSNVEFSVTVEDLVSGESKTYRNPAGRFASRADTEAF